MPLATLLEVNLKVGDEHIHEQDTSDSESDEDNDLPIRPGMSFTMKYTHTYNYKNSDTPHTVKVTVVSIGHRLSSCCSLMGTVLLGCVLKPEHPIYICIRDAHLGRPIYIYNDENTQIAEGGVQKILK